MVFWPVVFEVKMCLLCGKVVLMQSTLKLWYDCRIKGNMKTGLGDRKCVCVISIHKQISGETFHCSNASFWQRGLFLAGHACQSLKTSFSSLWIVKYSQINNSGDLFTRHTSGPCFARGGPEHRRGQAAPAGSFERLTGQGRFRPGPLPRNSSREGGATCCHHWEGGGRSCVLLVWQGVGPLH